MQQLSFYAAGLISEVPFEEQCIRMSVVAGKKSNKAHLLLMLWTKALYGVWKARNSCFFGDGNVNADQLIRVVIFRVVGRSNEAMRLLFLR